MEFTEKVLKKNKCFHDGSQVAHKGGIIVSKEDLMFCLILFSK